MKIVTKVTKRDIVLLIFLGVFLLVGGVAYFGLLPLGDAIAQREMGIESLEMKYQYYKEKMSSVSGPLDNWKTEYQAKSDAILPYTTSEDVERLLTDTILSCDVNVSSLLISDGEEETEYLVLGSYGATEKEEEMLTGIRSYTVEMLLEGEKQSLQALIDLWAGGSSSQSGGDALEFPELSIVSFSWVEVKTSAITDVESRLEITVRVYTLDKIEEEET